MPMSWFRVGCSGLKMAGIAVSVSLLFAVTSGYAQDNKSAATAAVGKSEMKAEEPAPRPTPTFEVLSKESAVCVSCHMKENPALYQQWGESKHYGANVGCYECHKAEPGDADAVRHKDFLISTIVSPKDCSTCHAREVEEFDKSHHATGGLIIGSLDNFLAEVVEGSIHGNMAIRGESAAAVQGCWQCHGSPVKVLPDGKLDPATWPNSGIGRLNPDGTKGACVACHQRHSFSQEQARRPEACGKCHLGPDHPQKEIYEESKHGIAFYGNVDKMNLNSSKWIPGEDYSAAPTCATCHMSATKDLPITHDIGDRISWTLRPAISAKIDEKAKKMGKDVKSWIDRRKDMKSVCTSCHQVSWVENWYEQFDSVVHTYNDKFAKPGNTLMKMLLDAGLRTKTAFDEKIEWTWFYLWHHEGRRVRHGAAMQAPDYVQWHGFFEVAERFYMELIPEARELLEEGKKHGKTAEVEEIEKFIAEVLDRPEHMWFVGKTAPGKKAHAEMRKQFMKEFNAKKGYGDKK
ncbi:multiheme c-type cytochrome [Cohaesibacter intestini]|uniref:multiheme c-type cytochrome n=1 Tax=Cohaesibacter intestini TaxID=2211145 RepID=UPI0018E591BD|nr:multiheme c-type cytochrome [Cohaesibacter intestini]